MIPAPVAVSRLPVGLVGQHDRWLRHQGPGDGHPLALSAGQLRRPMAGPIREAYLLQRVQSLLPGSASAVPV